MPACDHCGKVGPKVTTHDNGRTKLRLCPMCQAEYELKQAGEIRPDDLARAQQPWWRRWWRKLGGR